MNSITSRRRRGHGGIAVAAVMLMAGVGASPSQAADTPAYGTITITDNGTGGLQTPTTYEAPAWRCARDQQLAPGGVGYVWVSLTCTPNPQSLLTYNCPLMILTTTTNGGTAGGYVRCNTSSGSLDSGIVTGFDSSVPRSGNLGRVTAIVCKAYVDVGVLIPPYTVTCNEPGLPTL